MSLWHCLWDLLPRRHSPCFPSTTDGFHPVPSMLHTGNEVPILLLPLSQVPSRAMLPVCVRERDLPSQSLI
jgi:hypothetical protein